MEFKKTYEELNMLLCIEPQGEWYVIIVVSQDIHVISVRSCLIGIEDFSLLTLRLQVIPLSN